MERVGQCSLSVALWQFFFFFLPSQNKVLPHESVIVPVGVYGTNLKFHIPIKLVDCWILITEHFFQQSQDLLQWIIKRKSSQLSAEKGWAVKAWGSIRNALTRWKNPLWKRQCTDVSIAWWSETDKIIRMVSWPMINDHEELWRAQGNIQQRARVKNKEIFTTV